MNVENDAEKPLRMLHIEDSPRDAEIILELLIDAGFSLRMDWASNEQEFTSFLLRGGYDLILADYLLPGFDAPAALLLTKSFCPGIPFICISGAIGEEKAVELLKQGATDYVLKDQLDKLPMSIHRAIDEVMERKTRLLAEQALQQAHDELEQRVAERTKELNCLYGISALLELPDISLDEVLKRTVLLIPPAYQFPEITAACIVVNGQSFKSENFRETSWKQTSKIIVHDKPVGRVDVYYLGELPTSKEGPFLIEERDLLNAIAERIGGVVERMRAEFALRASEEQHRTILQTAMEGFWITDMQGRLLEINESYCRMSGYSKDELLAMSILDLEEVEMPPDTLAHIQRIMVIGENRFETRHRRKDESIFDVEISVQYTPENGGRLFSFIRDITERKKAEEKIRQNESRLKRMVDILQYPSETIRDFLDYALDQAIQMTESKIGYIYHYHDDRKEFVLNTWSREVMAECSIVNPLTCYELEKTGIWGEAVRQRRPILVNDFQAVHPLKKGYPEGHVQLFKFMTVPIFKDDNIVGVVGLANKKADYDGSDILQVSLLMEAVWKVTERKQAEEKIHELSQLLIQAQENERHLISCELHDSIAQNLSALKINFDTICNDPSITSPALREKLAAPSSLLLQTIVAVRNLAYDLRLPGLDEMGLVKALESYCEEASENGKTKVDFQSAGMSVLDLDATTEIHIYRLIQEALNNIRKHADTDHATIRLLGSSPNIILRIEDNGRGFDVKAQELLSAATKRMGIRSMQERVNLLQGQMTIQSQPMKGTKIFIKIPLLKNHIPKPGNTNSASPLL